MLPVLQTQQATHSSVNCEAEHDCNAHAIDRFRNVLRLMSKSNSDQFL